MIRNRIGPYEVLAKLGEGGMGEVYRARDTKLNRQIAIKVLPDLFANDPERLARLHREAQVLASLNHPNIAHIHGFEDSGGVHALVMELVEGPTLADRIAIEPLPLNDALAIAKQIGEALAAAHEQGIIHRDLKPANIKVREDGTVKVLDFGLARLMAPETSGANAGTVSQSPTLASPGATGVGMILGTAAYMSPEQAKGRAADKRSDVWAFGAVLYEMLSRRRPFEGDDLSDVLASVLKSEPDWSALPADIPAPIRTLIQRCLAKDPRLRVADISTALYVIGNTADQVVAVPALPAHPVSVPLWRRMTPPAAAAIVAGAAVGATLWPTTRPEAPRITRFSLSPSGAQTLQIDAQSRDVAITPDGTSIVYKGGTGRTNTRLFARMLGALEPTPLTIQGGIARAPFASADGQWIGFVEPSPVALNKVAITGGPALRICALDGASRGASWGDDDSIVFATASSATGLQRVSSAGGEPAVITTPNREGGESDHLYPHFLPGGQAVLFTITSMIGGDEGSLLAVLDLRAGTQKILMRGGSQSYYLPSGHLVYVAGGALRAVRFDLERLEVIGASIPVVPQIATLPTGTAEFDIARDGTLVYIAGNAGEEAKRTLVWVDRQGREEALKAAPTRAYLSPRLSPDGTRIAVEIREQGNDIWVWNIVRETLTRVTSSPGLDQSPAWTPDGRRLVFSSQADGAAGALFWQLADGAGAAERLTQSPNLQRPSAVLADGSRVLFWESGLETATDLKTLALDGDRSVQSLLQTPQAELNATVSPDGRWMAYQSNDSGQLQIFVRPFPKVDEAKIQISTGGGGGPVWSKSGDQLFFQAVDGAVMSVDVGRGGSWTAGAPTRLIDARYYGATALTGSPNYDVSPDGKRFLLLKESGTDSNSPPTIIVVQNWMEELKRLLPTTR